MHHSIIQECYYYVLYYVLCTTTYYVYVMLRLFECTYNTLGYTTKSQHLKSNTKTKLNVKTLWTTSGGFV